MPKREWSTTGVANGTTTRLLCSCGLAIGLGIVVSVDVSCSTSESSTDTAARAGDAGDRVAAPLPPFTLEVFDRVRIGSKSEEPNFHKAAAEIDISKGPFAHAELIVDLTSTCFPFEQWKSEPPPAGQNWPASCDAFDRNFEVALIDPAANDGPAIEVIRAITPFGGPLHIERDVTDILNALHGKRRLEVTIPSYSDVEGKVSGSNGGWNVGARIELTPGTPPRNVLAVVPLVYDDKTLGATPRTFDFTLPAGTRHSRVEYLATGHGGGAVEQEVCLGPADEFCKRRHTLSADGVPFVSGEELWRTDCKALCTMTKGGPFGSYCLENPCGAPASVQAPRANWCPGSETPPLVFEPEQLAVPGEHAIDILVNKVSADGRWEISAKVIAYGD